MAIIMVSSEISAGKAMGTPRPPVMMLKAGRLGGWDQDVLRTSCQWPFQDPKLEVPTIYKVYCSGLCKGISPENMALYGTNVPPF